MSDEYVLPYKDGYDGLVCVERTPVERICDHFAIRPTPVYHAMGEGMMVESWTLDHIPTGYRVFRGEYGSATRDECAAVAEMMSTAPFDWSTNDRKDINESGRLGSFRVDVFAAATSGKRITWDEWDNREDTTRGKTKRDGGEPPGNPELFK